MKKLLASGTVAVLSLLPSAAWGYHDGGGGYGHEDGEDCQWSGDCGDDGYYRHDYDQRYDQNYGSRDDRNRNRGRNRGAFSPGPFDRSPLDFRNACISLDCSNRDDRRREDQPS